MDDHNALVPASDFHRIVSLVEKSLEASSFRVYKSTYAKWAAWALDNGIDALALTYGNVGDFLIEQDATKTTKQRQLSALRSLLKILSILDYENPRWRAMYDALKLIKIGKMQAGGKERQRTALKPEQVWELLKVWKGDSLMDTRNHALLSVLFYVGLRRSEAAELKWADVNLVDGLIHVAHGKGDESREATIIGDSAIESLRRWKMRQSAAVGAREYVFCEIRKGDHISKDDKPMHPDAIRQIVKATCESAELDVSISPHDARRTLATNLLEKSPIADVQAQLGHKREATTLIYARPARAKERRARLKLDY